MEKIEKILLLAVLVAALLIIAVMSLFPEEKTSLDGPKGGNVYAKDKDPVPGESGGQLSKVDPLGGKTNQGSLKSPEKLQSPEDDGGLKGLLTLEDGGEESTGGKGDGAPLAHDEGAQGNTANGGGVGQDPISKGPKRMGEPDLGMTPSTNKGSLPGVISSLEEGGQFFRYTIQKGDAFSTILEKVCGTARQPVPELVLAANEQLNQNRIIAGHVLLIPKEAIAMGKKLLAKARLGGRPSAVPPSSVLGKKNQGKDPGTGLAGMGAKSTAQEVDSAVSGFAGIISLKRNESLGRGVVTEGSLYRTVLSKNGLSKNGPSKNGPSKNVPSKNTLSKMKGVPSGVSRPTTRGVRTYTVKKGDSFWKIAAKLLPKVPGETKAKRGARIHLLVQKLQDLNPEFAGGALDVGNKIRVPR